MIYEQQRVQELAVFVADQFRAVFDGPARAYFEIPSNQDGKIARGIYKVWALYVTDNMLVPELFERFKLHVIAIQERGGVMFVWRRYPVFTIEDGGITYRLSARFTVLDVHLDDVPWPEGSECKDGAPTPLLAS